MNFSYIDRMQRFDEKRGKDQLVSYFCTVGMQDHDIIHTLMTIKEMINSGYGLNEWQDDDLLNNSGVLTG
jgi:hypothetical protein